MSYAAPASSFPRSPTCTAPRLYAAPAYFAAPMSYPEYMQMYTDFTRGNQEGGSSPVPPQRHSTILQDHQRTKRSAGGCNSSAHERGESDTEEAIVREASNLKNVYVEKRDGLVTLLSGQLGTLKQLAQVILGLCGVVISVTGFSGANILKGGSVSSGFLVAGIVFIIASVSLSMLAFAQIRWVTQDLDDDLIHFITMVLKRRNRNQYLLMISVILLVIGLTFYMTAIAIAAMVVGNAK